MYVRHLIILVVVLFASSIVGQEEPLPLIALAVEPAVDVPPPTLADAARANDYATFAALYAETKDAAYAPLHELWTYSVNDPIGAFYGAERYAALARAYPQFAAYIDEYRIVDMRGNVFYPTSETRRFLLARALDGVQVAEVAPPKRELPKRRASFSPPKANAPQAPSELKPALRPPPVTVAQVAPIAQVAPVAPVVVAPAPAPAPQNSLAGRGLLLVIFGLIGIGLLALIMRTPGEPTVIRPRRDP